MSSNLAPVRQSRAPVEVHLQESRNCPHNLLERTKSRLVHCTLHLGERRRWYLLLGEETTVLVFLVILVVPLVAQQVLVNRHPFDQPLREVSRYALKQMLHQDLCFSVVVLTRLETSGLYLKPYSGASVEVVLRWLLLGVLLSVVALFVYWHT